MLFDFLVVNNLNDLRIHNTSADQIISGMTSSLNSRTPVTRINWTVV